MNRGKLVFAQLMQHLPLTTCCCSRVTPLSGDLDQRPFLRHILHQRFPVFVRAIHQYYAEIQDCEGQGPDEKMRSSTMCRIMPMLAVPGQYFSGTGFSQTVEG